MKKLATITAIMLTLLSGLFISGCVNKDFDTPEPNVPHVDFASNTTIAELKAMFTGAMDTITTDVVIQGVITGNDESGNIYKSLYIQDETGGIQIPLNQTGLYNDYRIGQRLFIKCKDLYLGAYGGMVQLGYNNMGSIGQIPAVMIPQHLFLDSLPGAAPAATVLTIPGITVANYATLIRLDSVHFETPGEEFATATATTNRNLVDEDDNVIIVRTSNYSSFRAELMPDGVGTVYAILSNYNGDNQLYIRDMNDLVGFSASTSTNLINEGFSSGTLGTFTQQSVIGDQVWAYGVYSGKNYASMSGYVSGSYYANEDWLISPSVNMDGYTDEILKFETAMKYGTAGDGTLKLYYSTDYVSGAPTTGTWTEMTGITISTGNFTWASSGNIDMSAITGTNVHIAFKFTCGTTGVPTWEVTNIKLKGTAL